MRFTASSLILSIVLLLVTLPAAYSQDFDPEAVRASKQVQAVRTTGPIEVDGALAEAAWSLAEPAIDFHQQLPEEFRPATERSEVRFLYDDEMLYVGAMLYDREPDRLIINELRRDFQGFQNDILVVVLDTFLDERNAYGFMTNAGGAQRDVQAFENGRRNDANWDGVWFTRSRILDDGWSVEIAIPFKTLRFPQGDDQEWGLNLLRLVRRKYEFSTWSPVPRQFSHYSVGFAGRLGGIAGVRSGRDLRITPFATGQFTNGMSGPASWGGDGDGGVDVKWGMTSSLLLDASYRTDFSQVEADEQQINLTRFSLFFPERRQFFLENPASFQVGLASIEQQRRDLVPFFSRRIGLSADGRPIPVIGGLRLTGRAGRSGIGLLTMQTDELEGTPGANFTVARVTHDVTGTAAVGAFYFGRETTGGGFNRVSGADVRVTPLPTLEFEAFAMRSETAGQAGDWAGRTGFRLDTDAHRARLGLLHIGDAFRHDLGFVRRRGVATIFGGYDRVLLPADRSAFMREQTVGVAVEATGDDRYERSLTRIGTLAYTLQFRDGSQLNAEGNTTYERLDAPFTVGSGLIVEAGEYAFDGVRVNYSSNQSAVVSGSAGLEAGEYWTGSQRTANGSLRVRINEHVAASASLTRSTVDLPQGTFTANLARLRLDWSFTPRMFLNAFVQYNGEADAWLSNIRFNLIHRPLSDVYLVWNETRQPGDTRRALLLKYTHLLAF
jgi:hypothetical protein